MGEAHPQALANLSKCVPFRKGYDERRHVGAPSLGRRVTAYLNELGKEDYEGNCVYTVADLKVIIKNARSAHAKVLAAKEILRSRQDGYDKLDRVPKAANSLDRICDRTDGKATVRMEIRHEQPSVDVLRSQMLELYAEHPQLLDQPELRAAIVVEAMRSDTFRQMVRPIVEQHRPELLPVLEQPVIDQTVVDDGL